MIDIQLASLTSTTAIALLSGSSLEADAYAQLMTARAQAVQGGARALLLDLSAVRRIAPSGLGALVELAASRGAPDLVFCGLSAEATAKVFRLGLDHALPLYVNQTKAIESPILTQHRLAGLRAVVLAAGKGTRAQPLTFTTPKAMFDILGESVLVRILGHLARAGVGEVVVNTGHLAPEIAATLHGKRFGCMPVFLSAEGMHSAAGWQGIPLGSATTLGRMHADGNLHGDTLVICGDALFDIDIAAIYDQHCRSGADVTIAAQSVSPDDIERYGIIVADNTGRITSFQEKPSRADAQSTMANTGIYLFSHRALACADTRADKDIATHLLPAVMAQGLRMQVFDQPFQWIDIGCLRDYFRALALGLAGGINGVVPVGTQIGSGVWAGVHARIVPGAFLQGLCHVGQDAEICSGAELHGPVVIGAGAVIEGPCIIRSSVILPGTRVQAGTVVDQVIAGGGWVVKHADANGGLIQRQSMLGIVPVSASSIHDWAAE